MIFRADLIDIMSGYRVFNRQFVKTYPILVSGFELETDMTLHALDKRFRVVEIPIDYKDRPADSFSKLNTVRDGLRVISVIGDIFKLYHPLKFFILLSIVFALLGLAAGAPVIKDYLSDGYIAHVPFAILATGLEVIAVILASIGLMLDSIANNERRRFELALLQDKFKGRIGKNSDAGD